MAALSMVVVATAIALSGCSNTSREQKREDIKTCAKLGLPYGSQDNYNCAMREELKRDRN